MRCVSQVTLPSSYAMFRMVGDTFIREIRLIFHFNGDVEQRLEFDKEPIYMET